MKNAEQCGNACRRTIPSLFYKKLFLNLFSMFGSKNVGIHFGWVFNSNKFSHTEEEEFCMQHQAHEIRSCLDPYMFVRKSKYRNNLSQDNLESENRCFVVSLYNFK